MSSELHATSGNIATILHCQRPRYDCTSHRILQLLYSSRLTQSVPKYSAKLRCICTLSTTCTHFVYIKFCTSIISKPQRTASTFTYFGSFLGRGHSSVSAQMMNVRLSSCVAKFMLANCALQLFPLLMHRE